MDIENTDEEITIVDPSTSKEVSDVVAVNKGNLDTIIPVGRRKLFCRGWMIASSAEILSVQTVTGEISTDAHFVYERTTRTDVVKAMEDHVPDNMEIIGFRLMVEGDYAKFYPEMLRINLSNEASFEMDIASNLSDDLDVKRAIGILRMFGEREPTLKSNESTRTSIFNICERILCKESKAIIDKALLLNDEGLILIYGWINDDGEIKKDVVCSDAESGMVYENTIFFRFYRHDVEKENRRFMGMFLLVDIPKGKSSLSFCIEDSQSKFCTFDVVPDIPTNDEIVIASSMLAQILENQDNDRKSAMIAVEKLGEVASKLYQESLKTVVVAEEIEFGELPASPDVSIVVPVYKSYYLIRHQLMDFSLDPYLLKQEIIYVLDSPDDKRWVTRLMKELWEFYRVPFRFIILNQNSGFATACNTGAEQARAPYTLFLNTDVFPTKPGWLQTMVKVLKEDSDVGVVGARLLGVGDTIQHIGMSWLVHENWGLYMNCHPHKGFPSSCVPAEGAVEVMAVTGACMLMRTEEFYQIGMLDSGFVRGDYEDSDLCLKLLEKGRKIVCQHEAELYHLEGSSYEPGVRSSLTLINAMRQHNRWASKISEYISL